MLAGEVPFTACVWVYTTFFGLENGAGFNVALLGGISTYTGCQFTEVSVLGWMVGWVEGVSVRTWRLTFVCGCSFVSLHR